MGAGGQPFNSRYSLTEHKKPLKKHEILGLAGPLGKNLTFYFSFGIDEISQFFLKHSLEYKTY